MARLRCKGESVTDIRCGGVILCGGRSQRMGRDKASLPFGDETMLARVARLLAEVVDPVVVVMGADQSPPDLATPVTYVRDRAADRGPLEGLAAGIEAVRGCVDAVYATSCDVPLLNPAFVSRMIRALGDQTIAVPRGEKYFHPLAAVYRTSVLPEIERLLQQDRLRPLFLFERVATEFVSVDALSASDPGLATLLNLNSPADYERALVTAGIEVSEEELAELFDGLSG